MKTAHAFLVFVFVVTTVVTRAQSLTDTIRIDSVTIHARNVLISENALVDDSLIALHYKNSTLGELLSAFGGVNVRQYSVGGAATVAPRGYSPQQIAVTWNGVNVTNPMLGQTDLSLLPCFFFDAASLRLDPNVLDGAPAGAVELSETFPINGIRISSQHSVSSLCNLSNAVRFQSGSKRWKTSLSIFDERNQNKFFYRNTTLFENPVTENRHAESNGNGASIGIKHVFGINSIHVGGFATQLDRELPPTMLQPESKDEQHDKTAAGFIRFERDAKTNLVADVTASFNEIKFFEGATSTFYKSNSAAYASSVNVSRATKIVDVSLHLQTLYTKALVNPNVYDRSEWQQGFQIALVKDISALRLNLKAEGMQRLRENDVLPFNYTFSLSKRLFKSWNLTMTHARLTRLPGLNDRYWQPGGNQDLEPELATRNNLKLSFEQRHQNITLLASSEVYFDLVENWIQWVPFGSVWSPHNVKSVKLYGVAPFVSLQHRFQKIKSSLTLRYNFNKAITQTSFATNDASVGKQLMYVPEQTFHANAEVGAKKWSAFGLFNYIGTRYITTENSDWLQPYATVDAGFAYNVFAKRFALTASAKVENITGAVYESVAWHPMPQQVFSITLNLHYHIPNS